MKKINSYTGKIDNRVINMETYNYVAPANGGHAMVVDKIKWVPNKYYKFYFMDSATGGKYVYKSN